MRNMFEQMLLKSGHFKKQDLKASNGVYRDAAIEFLWRTYKAGAVAARESSNRYIIGRKYSEGVFIFSKQPVWHRDIDKARTEARRLVDKHQSAFSVFAEHKTYGEKYIKKGDTSVTESIEKHKTAVQA